MMLKSMILKLTMRKLSLALCLAAVFSMGQACLYQNTRAAGLHPNFYQVKDLPYQVLGEEEAETSAFNFFWVAGVTDEPNVERAVLQAVNKRGGDAMIDIQVWKEIKVLIVGTVTILRIKGTVIQYVQPTAK